MKSGLLLTLLALGGQTILAQEQDPSRFLHVDHDRQLVTLDGEVTACLVVKNGSTANGNTFVLGDCSRYEHGIEPVAIDGEDFAVSMLHTRLDPTKCMQATHNGKVRKGALLRVYPCDLGNPLQHFRFLGLIQLVGTNWCAAYRGDRANVNQDPIILRKCDNPTVYANGWSWD